MQSVRSRIWTRVAVSTSCDDNDYTTGTSYQLLSFCVPRKGTQVCQTMLLFAKGIKRPHQQVMAMTPAGNTKLGCLFYIQDLKSNRFLLDTEVEISVIPPMSTQRTSVSNKTLLAANGTTIQTFGTTALNINFGMGRNFPWTFEIANVKSSIIGADFLLHFNLSVDLKNRRLIDYNTNTSFVGSIRSSHTTRIRSALPMYDSAYLDILKNFPSLTQPIGYNNKIRYHVTHRITTRRQPVHSKPRHLNPDKLKIAKAEFQHMLDLGIIRLSNSSWSSPFHMVPKKTNDDWWPNDDWWVQNTECCDYTRQVSDPTYPRLFFFLIRCIYFSRLDLVRAYHQIP